MKKRIRLASVVAAACCLAFAPLPLAAEDLGAPDAEQSSEPLTKADRKKLAAEKKAAKKKAARAKVPFKWFKSEKSALAFAKKHNLPVWMIYSDPKTCPVCVDFEKEILNNSKLKRSRGIGCGYISGEPMPEYQCTAKPSGAIVTPDGKVVGNLSCFRGWGVEQYIDRLKQAADDLEPQDGDASAAE